MKSLTNLLSKGIIALFLFSFFSTIALGQSFTVSPDTIFSTQISQSEYGEMHIDLTNTSGDTIVFEWVRLSNTFDSTWSQVFCDYQSCLAYIPESGIMNPVMDGQKGFIKLTLGRTTDEGGGSAKFKVWSQGDTASAVVLSFNVDALVGIEDDIASSFEVFPNPVADFLYVRNNASQYGTGTYRMIDLTGAIIQKQKIEANQMKIIDLSALAAGLYFVEFQLAGATVSKKIIKID